MFNVCERCGQYRADKTIELSGPYAVCPECEHAHPFVRQPLFVVGGASGTGKSTVCNALQGSLHEAVVLDADILWRAEFNTPENQYREFFETWLRLSKNIGQSGRPVMIFGAGFAVPDNLEDCIERRYFSSIHYLALVCSPETLVLRLQERPAWRKTHEPAFLEAQQAFNNWLMEYNPSGAQPSITLLDTSTALQEETKTEVASWFRLRNR